MSGCGPDLRALVPAACCWVVAGAGVAATSPSLLAVAVAAVVVAGLTAVRWPAVALTGVCIAVVAAGLAWRLAGVESSPVAALARDGAVVVADVTVRRDARALVAPGGSGWVVEVTLDRVEGRTGVTTSAGRATAFGSPRLGLDARDLVVGRSWQVRARLAPADASDEVARLRVLSVGPSGAPPWWWAGSESVRGGVRDAVAGAPADSRALVPALVDGDDLAIDDDLAEDFRRSGLTHLLAVSGTNLTIVLGTVLVLGRLVGVRRRAQWALGAAAIGAFVLLARPDPSVLRAAAMGAVGLAALGHGRPGGLRALCWAVVALLVLDPWLARSAGFGLSVCATGGILLLGPPLAGRLGDWLPRWAAVAVAVPTAAQVACTPLLAALTGQISLVAVFANLAVGPVVAPTTILGLAAGLLDLVLPAPAAVLGQAAAACAGWIVLVGRAGADLEGAAITWSAPWWTLLGVVPAAAGALLVLARRPAVLVGLALGLVVALWRPPVVGWPPEGWVLVACDVGQGDALVVATGPSAALVVDTGLEPEPVDRCLRRLGVDRVRLLVLTHAHADHVDGLGGVARGRRIDQIVVGSSGGPPLDGVPRHVAAAGESFSLGEIRAEVLWPRAGAREVGVEAANDASVVLRVEARGVRLLLTGDVEPPAQRAILRSGADLRADVLKVPHHGSAHQEDGFLAATGARIALVSAGEGNGYGHPAASTLDRLGATGAAWWRTDAQGDLAVVVHDGGLGVRTRH